MPAGFELTVFSLRRLPVARTLTRMPATILPDTMFSFTVLSVAPNNRMPTRFPVNVFSLTTLSTEEPRSMIPLAVLSRNSFSLIVFPTQPA